MRVRVSLQSYPSAKVFDAVVTFTFCNFSCSSRNQLMRAINGNTVQSESHLRVSAFNTNGLTVLGRWQLLLERDFDICMLSETHGTALHQKSLAYDRNEFSVLWGAPVASQSRSGVMCIARKGSFWAIQALPFIDPECQRYHDEGRLLVVQGLRGTGNSNIIIYGLYGHAGTRWDADKKKLMHKMLSAISRDVAARGPQIICVVGDLNLQPHESDILQTYLRTRFFYDAADWRQPGTAPGSTCHKGAGTRIDLIMMNSQASSLCQDYKVIPGFNARDHSEIQITLRMPLLAQHRY